MVYLTASMFTFFVSYILYFIKGEGAKKTSCLLMGFSINFYVFGQSALAPLAQNLIAFACMKCLKGGNSHLATFISSALCLATAQLHKQFYNPGTNGFDVPMSLMCNFSRVTSLLCCARDGYVIREKGLKKCNLKKREIEYAIVER